MPRKVTPATWAAIAVALLLWASAFAGIRYGLQAFGPGELALLRFGTASAVFAVYALGRPVRRPRRRDLLRLTAAGAFGITIYHVALNFGEVSVSAGAASLIIAAGPVFTALLAALFLGDRLSRWGWLGVAIAFSGVALITFGEGAAFAVEPRALLILVAAAATAAYFVVSKPLLDAYGAVEFTALAVWIGTIPMLVFAPGLFQQLATADSRATLAVVYLGIFPGAASYLLWSYALARMPASTLSSFLYLQPLNAIVIAWIWIREVPSAVSLVGGVISMLGVGLVSTLGRPREFAESAASSLFPLPDGPPAPSVTTRVITASSLEDYEIAAGLIMEYAGYLAELGFEEARERLALEVSSMPGEYAFPGGAVLVAYAEDAPAGSVVMRRLDETTCEARRLYVRPGARRLGIARSLMSRLIDTAGDRGYSRMRLVTLAVFEEAIALYESLGFVRIPEYRETNSADVVFFELTLADRDDSDEGDTGGPD